MIRTSILLAIIIALPGRAVFAGSDPILERYINLALTQNPGIYAADHRAAAMREEIPQAGALPNPTLGFGLKDLSADDPAFFYNEMSSKWISVEQMFPFPGTLGTKKDAARGNYEAMQAEADMQRVNLTADVSGMYYMWAYIRAATELIHENQSVLQNMADLTAVAYSTGMSTQSDVLRAQTELTRLDLRLAELKQQERSTIADINICCALPPGAMTTPPAPLTYEVRDIPFDTLWAWIQRGNPELMAARARQQSAEAEIRFARKMYYPEFSLGIEYMRQGKDTPADLISLMGGVSLPLYWKQNQNPMLREKTANREAAADDYANVLNRLHFELTDEDAKVVSLREQIESYRNTIIPQAERTFDAAKAGYVGGKVDFMTLLSSQMIWLDARMDYQMKVSEYNQTWAKVEALTGNRLP